MKRNRPRPPQPSSGAPDPQKSGTAVSAAQLTPVTDLAPVPPIYMVAGSKGGVGKSMLSMILIDLLLEKASSVLFIETDTTNPDVYRCLQRNPDDDTSAAIDGVLMRTAKLEVANGWVDMVNALGENPDRVVVINTAARTNAAVTTFGKTLQNMLPELGRELVNLWVINRQRDSMDQLVEHLEVFDNCTTHVVRNGFFGEESQFELYNNSKLRSRIERAGGKSLVLPGLADRVADTIYIESMAISRALREMPIGSRGELIRWREATRAALKGILTP